MTNLGAAGTCDLYFIYAKKASGCLCGYKA